jgi:nucleoid DNA-binding protein
MDYFKRVRLTPAEKVTKLQQENPHRMGLEEISLLMTIGTGLSKRQSRETLDAFLQVIIKALREGREVMLPGFGAFKAVQKPARRVRKPKKQGSKKGQGAIQPELLSMAVEELSTTAQKYDPMVRCAG